MVTQQEYNKLKKEYDNLMKSYIELYEANWRQEDLNRVLKKQIYELQKK
jgi:hypothetical protein